MALGTIEVTTQGRGTLLTPIGVVQGTIELWGGGGGGGGATGTKSAGGGGAGGAYILGTFAPVPGSYIYQVGTAGTAGTGSPTAGGSSWFGSTTSFVAVGGAAGTSASANNGGGGGGVGGTTGNVGFVVGYPGGNGANGVGGTGGTATAGGGGGGAGTSGAGGNAGGTPSLGGTASPYGGGAGGRSGGTAGTSGTAGTQAGGGGGGAFAPNTIDRAGGAGAAGRLRYTYDTITYDTLGTDNFDRADGTVIGTDWTQTGASQTWELRGSQLDKTSPDGTYEIITWTTALNNTVAADYGIEATFRVENIIDASEPGLVLRFTDTSNYYIMVASLFDNDIHITRAQGGTFTTISGSVSTSLGLNTDYTLRFQASGSHLQGWLNGTLWVVADDDQLTAAGVPGLQSDWQTYLRYNNFSVFGTLNTAPGTTSIYGYKTLLGVGQA